MAPRESSTAFPTLRGRNSIRQKLTRRGWHDVVLAIFEGTWNSILTVLSGTQKEGFMTRTGQHQRCISAIHWLEASGALALGAIFVTAVIGTPAAQAQTYTVVHRFKGPPTDGAGPKGHV